MYCSQFPTSQESVPDCNSGSDESPAMMAVSAAVILAGMSSEKRCKH